MLIVEAILGAFTPGHGLVSGIWTRSSGQQSAPVFLRRLLHNANMSFRCRVALRRLQSGERVQVSRLSSTGSSVAHVSVSFARPWSEQTPAPWLVSGTGEDVIWILAFGGGICPDSEPQMARDKTFPQSSKSGTFSSFVLLALVQFLLRALYPTLTIICRDLTGLAVATEYKERKESKKLRQPPKDAFLLRWDVFLLRTTYRAPVSYQEQPDYS